MSRNISDTVMEVIKQRYPDHAFVLFYGSHAKEEEITTPQSDLDVMVLYSRATKPFRETFRATGYLFDVFVYDIESINYLVHHANRLSMASLIHIILESTVLPEANPISDHLKSIAEQVNQSPPVQRDLGPLRHYITNTIDDLQWCQDARDKTALMVDLYRSLMNLMLATLGKEGHTRKHAVAAIRLAAPDFFMHLDTKFHEGIQNQDPRSLILLAYETLQPLGGPLREGFRLNLQERARLAIPPLKGQDNSI
ncbi:MAG: hypothetical protein V4447_08695 [Pseudomonadota bacterium]